MNPTTKHKNGSSRVWQVISALLVLAVGALVTTTVDQRIRIAKIESNRFTLQDAIKLEARTRLFVTRNYPPEWLKREITEIKAMIKGDVGEIKLLIKELEARVRSIERKP